MASLHKYGSPRAAAAIVAANLRQEPAGFRSGVHYGQASESLRCRNRLVDLVSRFLRPGSARLGGSLDQESSITLPCDAANCSHHARRDEPKPIGHRISNRT